MNQPQRELRRAAAQSFMESLEQLQTTLQASENPPSKLIVQPSKELPQPEVKPANFDLHSFEQAVADIEQFIERNKGN
jgi:hypothetical protein